MQGDRPLEVPTPEEHLNEQSLARAFRSKLLLEPYWIRQPLRNFSGCSRPDTGGAPREWNRVAIVRVRDAFPTLPGTILSILSTVSVSASLSPQQNRRRGACFSSFDFTPCTVGVLAASLPNSQFPVKAPSGKAHLRPPHDAFDL